MILPSTILVTLLILCEMSHVDWFLHLMILLTVEVFWEPPQTPGSIMEITSPVQILIFSCRSSLPILFYRRQSLLWYKLVFLSKKITFSNQSLINYFPFKFIKYFQNACCRFSKILGKSVNIFDEKYNTLSTNYI